MTIITNRDHVVVSVSLIPGLTEIPGDYHCYFPAELKNGIPKEGDIYKEGDIEPENSVIEEGTCLCIYEPNGDGGLEGYNLKQEYGFKHMSRDKKGQPYYRDSYYETCGPGTFKKYFSKS